ncbi:Transposon Ty3-I Gag-Pol polyprotein [Araneus ventricosus]|uniref:Transposon Ty3-I Gag-Pol polyprotein n=1 Tax=Araneus ventricosus TaxID=182803 RepID=A0A4Y2HRD3_ARAVE|nr:Transposon Ty3-I Gag-Pol polyprotein [Araneus ventricosus]
MTQYRINTSDHPPIKQYPRRLRLARKEEADHLVKDMLDNGIIEESSGPWASPIVLVKKKDGSTRFCVDYRKLNEIPKKDSYPLPRIDDTLDALNGSQWFTTLDLKSGYWQLRSDVKKERRRPSPRDKDFGNLRLQEYDFEIQHRKWTSHGNADALSRRPCRETSKHCSNAEKKFGIETDTSVKVLTTTSLDLWSSCGIQKAQLEDPAIKPILEKKLNSADRPSWQEIALESPATKRYWAL